MTSQILPVNLEQWFELIRMNNIVLGLPIYHYLGTQDIHSVYQYIFFEVLFKAVT